MKNRIIKTGMAILICLFMQSVTKAQTLVPPGNADILWLTGPSIGCGINTAVIDFPCDDITPNYPYGRLAACAYGGGPGGVVVRDLNNLHTVNITYPVFSSRTMASCPDVILGNKSSSPNPTQDFIMAVAFINDLGEVEVNYFDINYVAQCDTFTVTYHSRQIIATGMGWTPLGTVHIDVVAQTTNTSLYGMPLCDKFFVTYDATTTAPVYNVFATYGTLNTFNATVAGPVNISTGWMFTTDSWQPDVAGIERGPMVGAKKPIACITYVEQGTRQLYYQEWDPLGAVVGAYSVIGGTTTSGGVDCSYNRPRIDADDNYTTNAGGYASCKAKVVSEYFDPTTSSNDVREYNGGTTINWIDLFGLPVVGTYPHPLGGGSPSTAYYHYRPTVAYGANSGAEYVEAHCVNISAGDFFMMNPLDKCGGLALDPSAVLSYFEVNSAYPATSTFYSDAASTPCNFVNDISLVTWTDAGNIYYKTTPYAGGGTGFAFRKAPAASSQLTKGAKGLAIYPNPANGSIIIDNLASVPADRFVIKNMLGQIVLDGTTTGNRSSGKQEIDVSRLTNGCYIVCVYNTGLPVGNGTFVKN